MAHRQHNDAHYHTTPTSGASDKVTGKLHEVKGGLKEDVGKVVHSNRMRAEGALEKNAGKAEQKEGDIKRSMGH